MINRVASLVLPVLMLVSFISLFNASMARACPATMSFGIGGYGDPNAGVFAGEVDHRVSYSGALNDINGGVAALKRDIDSFRSVCNSSKIVVAGFSQGAGIAHVYLAQHKPENASAVLFSDPKQHRTGESDGLFSLGGSPIAGTDDDFGGIKTVSICYIYDIICNRSNGLIGWYDFAFNSSHMQYDFDVDKYAGMTGVVWTDQRVR